MLSASRTCSTRSSAAALPELTSRWGYGLSGTARIYDWVAATAESERIDVLLVWVKGACHSPHEACTGQVSNSIRQRRFFYADIPVARTRVTYQVVEVPARCVHILRISDDDFGLPGDDG